MNALISAIIGLIGAIPMMIELTNVFIDMWIESRIGKITDKLEAERNKLMYLKKTIREAKSDEERIALSIILSDYRRGKV